MLKDSLGLRIAFIFTGGFLLYEGFQNWLRGDIIIHKNLVFFCLISYALAFLMLFLSTLEDRFIQKFEILIPLTLIFATIFSIYIISEIFYKGAYRTDAIALTHYAAHIWNFPSWNPYPFDLQKALGMYSVDVDYLTFTLDGNLITRLNYPALHILIYAPFILIGLEDMRWVTLLFEIGIICYIYAKAPKNLRALMLIPIFAGSDLAINFTAGCITDFLWVLPLLVVIFEFRNEHVSGAFYGLSCAIKQIPWIFAPFLLISVWKESKFYNFNKRVLRTIRFMIISIIFFIIPNVFFMIKDIRAWISGISQPIFGNLLVLSQGLSMLTQSGIVPLPMEFYTVCTIVVFLTLIVNYFVYYDKIKYAMWVFPAIIMWFSYRGLQNYFIYWVPLLVASIIMLYDEKISQGVK